MKCLWHHPESDSLFVDHPGEWQTTQDGALCNDVTGQPWAIQRAKEEGIDMGWGTGEVPAKVEIESGIAPPPKRSRTARASKVNKAAEGLLTAIAFVEGACGDDADFKMHVRMANGYMIAYDGSVAAGHPIEEDLQLCPHLKRLKEAASRAGATMSLSAQDNGRLSIAGDVARFTVPCLPGASLYPVMPDPSIAVLDDRLKAAFAAVHSLAKDEADTIHEQSVLLRSQTVVGCNGKLVFEAWHGIDLPPGLGIPHKAAKLISKQVPVLTGFGWDEGRSVTFWFENGAWIKTQLMAERWPDIDTVLNKPAYYSDAPPALFDALKAVLSFSEDGAVHFNEDKLKSTYASAGAEGVPYGAAYDVPGLVKGSSFTGNLLKLAEPYAKQIDYTTHEDMMMLLNPEMNVRGVLMKRRA